MSKVLYVLRHAQSVGKQSNQRDYDRVLAPSGAMQARQLGIKLKQLGIRPDRVLSSSAVRARDTFEMVNESLGISEEKIEFKEELYEALMVHCLDEIHVTEDAVTSILLVGHNPWISMLSSTLCGRIVELAPCEFLGLTFAANRWKDISDGGKESIRIKPD